MKKCITYLGIGGTLLFAGCFTSVTPVYDDNQVFQDKRVEGVFENAADFDRSGDAKKDGSVWTIALSTEQA
jgi:hypothetical protein